MNDRRAVLTAALGFLALEPRAPELQRLHRCFMGRRLIRISTTLGRQPAGRAVLPIGRVDAATASDADT